MIHGISIQIEICAVQVIQFISSKNLHESPRQLSATLNIKTANWYIIFLISMNIFISNQYILLNPKNVLEIWKRKYDLQNGITNLTKKNITQESKENSNHQVFMLFLSQFEDLTRTNLWNIKEKVKREKRIKLNIILKKMHLLRVSVEILADSNVA